MKIACIALNSNLIEIKEQTNIIDFINKKLYEIGENISLISYFDNSLEKLKQIILDKFDLIFFIGTSQVIYNHNIKDNLSRIFNEKLNNNQVCYSNLKKYCENHNITFSMQEEMEVLLPTNSIPLISNNHYNNGFMYKYNNSYIIFLPDSLEFTSENYFNYILPLINDLIKISSEYQVIKCFGILEKDIKNLISEEYNNPEISITIISEELDNTIYIRYNPASDFNKIQNTIANIITKLNKYIYSLEDESIYQMAVNLLKIQHKTIAIAETLTLGNITKELALLDSGIINSNFTFTKFNDIVNSIDIDYKIISENGKYSVNTIYECSNSLLANQSADIVLFVLGDLIDSENTCFMAVGDTDGIHVYKNKINIKNEKLIDNLSKTAVFYLIKKLKQNDLHFI
ncbi:MAG: hypothetical protein MRZ09_04095 [Coprobacillus sp.]|nr:hypothetical protein [Coprobacillus sp.]